MNSRMSMTTAFSMSQQPKCVVSMITDQRDVDTIQSSIMLKRGNASSIKTVHREKL